MLAALSAALAALTATVGDLLMLYVSNSRRPELSLPAIPAASLQVGGVLGVLASPLYAWGYHSASRIVEAASRRASRAVFWLGSIGAVLGAVIHGLTALQIHADLAAGAVARDPLSSVASWGPTILVLWALAAVSILLASFVFGWVATRGPNSTHRLVGLANPALVMLVLVIVGMTTPLLRSFLAPAAPNLAHVVFFGACVWAHLAGRRRDR